MTDYYNRNVSDVIKALGSSENGLTQVEAEKRLKEFGYNELDEGEKVSALEIFFSQFKNALIILLILAGALSLFLGEMIESTAIFSIVLLNTLLGFFQEYNAEKSIEALKKVSAPTATVLRDGLVKEIPSKEVVPGDIILLEAGDIVPADARITEVSSLQIDEASLTGESVPPKKSSEVLETASSVADRNNMAFMGTAVTYGKGRGIVTVCGMQTELGKIASSLQTTKEVNTPLQNEFEKLAKQIGFAAIVLIMIVLMAGTLQGTLTFAKMLLFAIVLAVATIPSALPVIVTIGLSKGANDLAKKNMLIKKLPAAESLGAASMICSDKTGTITKNQMTITNIFYDNQIFNVEGTGYNPEGEFYVDGKKSKPDELILEIGVLCNNATLTEENGQYSIIGDPTEGSLIVLGKKGGLNEEELKKDHDFLKELPFDSERKRMSVIFENKKNLQKEVYVKGAPDLLLNVCDRIIEGGKIRELTDKDREKILDMNNAFAEDALRVLGLAYKIIPESKEYDIDVVESNLVFTGLVGMIDPPRDEVKKAIEQCQSAGIGVMIITGDHAITAKAVAEKIGLFKKGDIIITGEEVEKMGDDELERKIEKVRIIARALPIQKLRIVDALQKKGHIVAMTGDGVNDAPALKKADIGIAMGITGTGVAKEVSKAILTDDNFATIVNAIEEGRNIYDKMIKSAKYLLSCNSGEIFTVLMAIMLNFPLPLLPLQILLINMLTDSSPALGLGFESSEKDIMKRKPRDPRARPLTKSIFISIVLFGLVMGAGTLFIFFEYIDVDLDKARTIAFTTLVMFQMFAVMSSRSLEPSLKKLNPFSNKLLLAAICVSIGIQILVVQWSPLQIIFKTVSLSPGEWLKIIGISFIGFIIMEATKVLMALEKNQVNYLALKGEVRE